MKKLLLSLGTVAAIAAPVASVIACSKTEATTTKTVTSKLTTDELNKLTPARLSGKAVKDLDAMFGVTTGVAITSSLQDGVTYKDGKLTFKAGPLGEEKTYTFVITPKPSQYDLANIAIAKMFAGEPTTKLGTTIKANKNGAYGSIVTEGDLKRVITIVKTGFKVKFTYPDKHVGIYYFPTNDLGAIDALKAKIEKLGTTIKRGNPDPITTKTVVYTDATQSGASVVIEASEIDKKLANLNAGDLTKIKALFAKL